MNRLRRRILDLQSKHFFLLKCRILPNKSPNSIIKPFTPIQLSQQYGTQTPHSNGGKVPLSRVFSLPNKNGPQSPCLRMHRRRRMELVKAVLILKDKVLLRDDVGAVLEEEGADLFREFGYPTVVIELLDKLQQTAQGIEVLNWRREQCNSDAPMIPEEYTKGITVASRCKDMNLANVLFKEAKGKKLLTTPVYNSLMSGYMYNYQPMNCQAVFRELKDDPSCSPTIVSYNIIISTLGRIMLVDHMEAVVQEMNDRNLSPTLKTYKGILTGYVTAWMWKAMEETYLKMKAGPIKPDRGIHMLMLRGYAHSGNIEKMEHMYKMVVRDNVKSYELYRFIGIMAHAYARSSRADKVDKVNELVARIPEHEYKPWLNILLITLYANADLFEQMEKSINDAFQRKTCVTAVSVMRCIISTYFRQNAADKLAEFLHRSEHAGWRICRSLYHCKMVMYASQNRLSEMEMVLKEMSKINMPVSKKTFWILYKAYQKWNERYKLETVVGLMCKSGYGIPLDSGYS